MGEQENDSEELQVEVNRRAGCPNFDVLKVFAGTTAGDRAVLGEMITGWLAANSHLVVVDREITQSSDNEFHCLTVTLFCIFRPGIEKRTDFMRRHMDMTKPKRPDRNNRRPPR